MQISTFLNDIIGTETLLQSMLDMFFYILPFVFTISIANICIRYILNICRNDDYYTNYDVDEEFEKDTSEEVKDVQEEIKILKYWNCEWCGTKNLKEKYCT